MYYCRNGLLTSPSGAVRGKIVSCTQVKTDIVRSEEEKFMFRQTKDLQTEYLHPNLSNPSKKLTDIPLWFKILDL